MAKWQVGLQVAARAGSILADGDERDGIVGVGAGAFGIVVASHGTFVGLGERFARRLSVRFADGVLHGVGSDELVRLNGALGDVSRQETAEARVADAVAQLDAMVRWREVVTRG